ncbi:MAG: UDP-N-acetylglucosamine 2-epimerase, partial [Bacteroidales bacterium]|nr:UDP-N-acetylglucosamine 2-epimerase [Bacteroidales bacterium]
LDKEGLRGIDYVLCTIHRDNNTDQPERLNAIFKALLKISESNMVVLPLHPRTSKLLNINLDKDLYDKITNNKNIKILPPASFLDMIVLERHAQMVVTDSGGVQKEAFFFQKPCLILRSETEWKEIVECGAAVITDADEQKIIASFNDFVENPPHKFPEIFGDGKAAEFICKEMLENL